MDAQTLISAARFCGTRGDLANIMKALFVSFPASDYESSARFYEQAAGLEILREFDGVPHRFKNCDLGGIVLKVYE